MDVRLVSSANNQAKQNDHVIRIEGGGVSSPWGRVKYIDTGTIALYYYNLLGNPANIARTAGHEAGHSAGHICSPYSDNKWVKNSGENNPRRAIPSGVEGGPDLPGFRNRTYGSIMTKSNYSKYLPKESSLSNKLSSKIVNIINMYTN